MTADIYMETIPGTNAWEFPVFKKRFQFFLRFFLSSRKYYKLIAQFLNYHSSYVSKYCAGSRWCYAKKIANCCVRRATD